MNKKTLKNCVNHTEAIEEIRSQQPRGCIHCLISIKCIGVCVHTSLLIK
jgi:hypothetical protein